MSLQWSLSRVVPTDTAALGQELLSAQDAMRRIGDSFDNWMPQEEQFAPLYSDQDVAPSPLLLALVTVFQMLKRFLTGRRLVPVLRMTEICLHAPVAGYHRPRPFGNGCCRGRAPSTTSSADCESRAYFRRAARCAPTLRMW
jgi:hypothetical protein